MKLRNLENKDAIRMLEWMHDEDVTRYMGKDFGNMTIHDCERFILESSAVASNLHQAIVNDEDEYMGTVSLKNINVQKKDAEFAITIRKCAMGNGYSRFGMNEILKIAFEELKLNMVYWYVNRKNLRAVRFYDKMHFGRMSIPQIEKMSKETDVFPINDFEWYMVTNEEFELLIQES